MAEWYAARVYRTLARRVKATADGHVISRLSLVGWTRELGLGKPARFYEQCFSDSRVASLQIDGAD
eukprot:7797804-Pyramimonas_sp.AAC.1